MTEQIDAHHHLWRYAKEEYGWIGVGMEAIARDFLPHDLERELASSGIKGSIAVQARQTLEETEWLLSLTDQSEMIRGVVGWAPIASSKFPEIIERWKYFKKLKGLRHVVQDEPDDEFLFQKDFNAGIALCQQHGLVYDILILERQIPAAISFVDRHPGQVFVLDHIAKPRIRERKLEPWRTNICELARRENVYCKLSGLVTEADWANWSLADLQPYLDVVLEAFGTRRLMAGSDWPVCLLAATPQKWFATVQEFIRPLSVTEQEMILGAVATQVYSLNANANVGKQ